MCPISIFHLFATEKTMECNENKLEKIRKTLQRKRSGRKLRRKKKQRTQCVKKIMKELEYQLNKIETLI